MLLGMVKLLLGEQTLIDNSLVLGAILILVVLLLPRGLVPSIVALGGRRAIHLAGRARSTGTRRRRPNLPVEPR